MTNEGPANQQLRDELADLTRTCDYLQVALNSLVTRMGKEVHPERRVVDRERIDSKVSVRQISDAIELDGFDISETGLACTSEHPLRFRLKYERGGTEHETDGDLAWARVDEAGHCQVAFNFQPTEDQNA